MGTGMDSVTVTYTVGGQKVTFKAPKNTQFYGEDYNPNNKGSIQIARFNEIADKNKNMGTISPEKHKIITALRYADGNSDLSKKDFEIFANRTKSPESCDWLKNYITQSTNNSSRCVYASVQNKNNLFSTVRMNG